MEYQTKTVEIAEIFKVVCWGVLRLGGGQICVEFIVRKRQEIPLFENTEGATKSSCNNKSPEIYPGEGQRKNENIVEIH